MLANTLRYQLTRPVFVLHTQRRKPSVKSVVEQLDVGTGIGEQLVSAESEAIRFYLINHMLATMRGSYELDENIPPGLMDMLEESIAEYNKIFVRAFWYLVMICSREQRHVHQSSHYKNTFRSKFTSAEDAEICLNVVRS